LELLILRFPVTAAVADIGGGRHWWWPTLVVEGKVLWQHF